MRACSHYIALDLHKKLDSIMPSLLLSFHSSLGLLLLVSSTIHSNAFSFQRSQRISEVCLDPHPPLVPPPSHLLQKDVYSGSLSRLLDIIMTLPTNDLSDLTTVRHRLTVIGYVVSDLLVSLSFLHMS